MKQREGPPQKPKKKKETPYDTLDTWTYNSDETHRAALEKIVKGSDLATERGRAKATDAIAAYNKIRDKHRKRTPSKEVLLSDFFPELKTELVLTEPLKDGPLGVDPSSVPQLDPEAFAAAFEGRNDAQKDPAFDKDLSSIPILDPDALSEAFASEGLKTVVLAEQLVDEDGNYETLDATALAELVNNSDNLAAVAAADVQAEPNVLFVDESSREAQADASLDTISRGVPRTDPEYIESPAPYVSARAVQLISSELHAQEERFDAAMDAALTILPRPDPESQEGAFEATHAEQAPSIGEGVPTHEEASSPERGPAVPAPASTNARGSAHASHGSHGHHHKKKRTVFGTLKGGFFLGLNLLALFGFALWTGISAGIKFLKKNIEKAMSRGKGGGHKEESHDHGDDHAAAH